MDSHRRKRHLEQAGSEPRLYRSWRWLSRSRQGLGLLATILTLALVGTFVVVLNPPGAVDTDAFPPVESVAADSDKDGLADEVESSGWLTLTSAVYRTDPTLPDTDGDGLSDGVEAGARVADSGSTPTYQGVSDPTKPDSDGDLLGDKVEVLGWTTQHGGPYLTRPLEPDTDSDGLTDGDEAGDLVTGLTLAQVYVGVSDPTKPDSDDDDLGDKAEVSGWWTQRGEVYRTKPLDPDSDGDGLTDGDEAGPLVTTTSPGATYSGLSSPLLADSDADDLDDAAEADLSLDAFDPDSDDDQIGDGREVQVVGSAPEIADTDNDGFEDGYEDSHREDQGLDPLSADVKVSSTQFAIDFATGAILGELSQADSLAWLLGNLAAGGASFIPGVGWIVGTVADLRDAVGAAIRADWVGLGFSAVGLIPDIGDAMAIPGKAARFVARCPNLTPEVAATLSALDNVPVQIRVEASRQIWKSWGDLVAAGVGEKALLRLQQGRTNLDSLHQAVKGQTPFNGPSAGFVDPWNDGERYLEDALDAHEKGVTRQVVVSTDGCSEVCNSSNRRVVDVLVNGVAHESKVGYKALTRSIEKQIRSDAWAIEQGTLEGAHWHFFASGHTNKVGASKPLLDLLNERGIKYTIHLPVDA